MGAGLPTDWRTKTAKPVEDGRLKPRRATQVDKRSARKLKESARSRGKHTKASTTPQADERRTPRPRAKAAKHQRRGAKGAGGGPRRSPLRQR